MFIACLPFCMHVAVLNHHIKIFNVTVVKWLQYWYHSGMGPPLLQVHVYRYPHRPKQLDKEPQTTLCNECNDHVSGICTSVCRSVYISLQKQMVISTSLSLVASVAQLLYPILCLVVHVLIEKLDKPTYNYQRKA